MLKLAIITTFVWGFCQNVFAKEHDKQCLATVINKEARGESVVGKRAVMDVVINRAKATGKSICQVIRAKGQFSWVVDGMKMMPYTAKMQRMLEEVEEIGRVLINENYKFFFVKRLNPHWARKLNCVVIESHKFCREGE